MTPERGPASKPLAGWLGPIAAAVAIWPVAQRTVLHPDAALPERLALWLASIAVFLGADAVAARARRLGAVLVALLVATGSALFAIWLIPVVYGGAALTASLLVAVAARLHPLPPRVARPWIAAQSIGLVWIYGHRWNFEVGGAAALGFFGFQCIALLFVGTAARERRARRELAGALEALSQTRAELTAAARRAERNQIAADLHDVLGHHLVALQLQLEAATTAADGKHLDQARQLARLLLAEVRGVVDEIQSRDRFDFFAALQHLGGIEVGPAVEVVVEGRAAVGSLSSTAAKECFRAVQEAVTNARKHARARRITITVGDDEVIVRDDGRSWQGEASGRGLRGMEDRCRAAGCTFRLERRPGAGTTVRFGLPRADGAEA